METSNKYESLNNIKKTIAVECNCSVDYVNKVLRGDRHPKTIKATKAQKIFATADKLIINLK